MIKTTTVIDDQHPMAPYVLIVNANGDIIPKVKSYNIETQEAEVFVMDEKGHAIVDWPNGKGEGAGGVIRTEKKVLEGSRLVFRDGVPKDKQEPSEPLEMQVGTFIDRRQYAVDIYRNNNAKQASVPLNDLPIPIEIEVTGEDTVETVLKQIKHAALTIQFPGELEFDASSYVFDITRL